jgi:hypothetical protein
MTAGSSTLAMIRALPPQRSQLSMSMRNTRLSRCAQVIARCRSAGLRSLTPVLLPRPAGVT